MIPGEEIIALLLKIVLTAMEGQTAEQRVKNVELVYRGRGPRAEVAQAG